MDKVFKLEDNYKEKVRCEIFEILESLDSDYDLEVVVSERDVDLIVDEFYNYYKNLGIVYEFCGSMINHFNDIAIMALENNSRVDLNFILNGLEIFEFCDSCVEVELQDTKKVLSKIRNGVGGNYAK